MKPRVLFGLMRLQVWLIFGGPLTAGAALQFDVFLGYEGIVREASWFPVVCEIKNDGPAFVGTVEVGAGSYDPSQVRRAVVELPTGTLKRLVIPVFSTTRNYSRWDVRLLDERGKVRAEQANLAPRKQIAAGTPLIGALTRTAGGAPTIRPLKPQQADLQPVVVRLQRSIFPDNPLVLEGLNAIYLSSQEALGLTGNQVNALLAWLNAGGHLIIGVEQVSDVTSTPWLSSLFPCALKDMRPLAHHPELQDWLRSAAWQARNAAPSPAEPGSMQNPRRPGVNPQRSASAQSPAEVVASRPFSDLADDFTFEGAELVVATGEVREGHIEVAAGDTPLIVTANRGRGRVTALLFSPEREPFRSWKNLPTFWARITDLPLTWYASSDFNRGGGGLSSDGIFGAMLQTTQVHKLPLEWLLVLLLVYLVVIGPLDQYWLKRIGRPMLTWITFPCYVILFSLVIYLIGYKLRAGESEWNELHIVDVLQNADQAELRGRTYVSVYSPSNQRYRLEGQEKYSTLRGEFVSYYGEGRSSEKATVTQIGDSFKAEVYVPVWTSQLFVNDWWQSSPMPLTVKVSVQGEDWLVTVENQTDQPMSDVKLAAGDSIMPLGEVPANQSRTFRVPKGGGARLAGFLSVYFSSFLTAVQSRQHAFGSSQHERISDLPNAAVGASFISQAPSGQNFMSSFIAPPGLDISPVLEHGQAVLFAWAENYSPVKPTYQFSPRRSHHYTLWRVPVMIK